LSTAFTAVGGTPGELNCFSVGSSENQTPGESSNTVCLSGSGLRRAGDLDCDGGLSAADILAEVASLFGAAEPGCAGYPAADADLDGAIDAADLAYLVRAIHGPL
jgi:hypothetical protein